MTTAKAVPEQLRSFSWKDLDEWTDDGSIRRGKGYVGNVSNVAITGDDHVIATVSGTYDYATEIWFGDDGLEGQCTCPVGSRCKHTVALILKCIDILGAGGTLPVADDDDERIEELREGGFEEDEYGDFDFDDDDDDDDDDGGLDDVMADGVPRRVRNARARRAAATTLQSADELASYIDALDEASAKQVIIEILSEHGDIREDMLRRVRTERSDVAQLLKMARKELKRLSREEAWVNPWKHEYHIPDYKPLRHILEKLLAEKAFDELVAFGDDLKLETFPQIEAAHDEGDTAGQICSCMEVVAKAVRRSSLSSVERLRWFAELHAADDYCAFEDIYNPFAHPGDWKVSDWSAFADSMLAAAKEGGRKRNEDSSDYELERRMRRIGDALVNAGRTEEAKNFQTDWLRRHGQYVELAKFLLGDGDAESAWKAAMDGFTAGNARDPYKDLRERLRRVLREIAVARGDMRLALSLQTEDFLANPTARDFFSLLEAARKEGLDGALRPWLVRFLEKGNCEKPCPLAPSGVPLLSAARRSVSGIEILLRIALEEKDADETLRRWKQLKSQGKRGSVYGGWDPLSNFADEVADALAKAHPEEALAIWKDTIARRLRYADNGNYALIAQAFRKSRPVMKRLGRLEEWMGRIRSLQVEYKRRPNFVKALEELFGPMSASSRPILETRHPKR